MNDALLRFQSTICPEIPLDNSNSLTEKLLHEIAKLKEEIQES